MIKSSGAQQQKTFAEETLNELVSKIQYDVAVHLKKEINEISNLHNEIMLIEYKESDFKQHYYKYKKSKKNFLEKLQSIKDSINYLSETDVNSNKLQKKKQDCLDQTIEFINKYEESTLEKINEIDKKTKKWQENLDNLNLKNDNNNNDMSESLLPPEENEEANNEEANQYKLQATALLNRNDFLNERDKEIKGIHKISGMINGLSEEMKKNVYEGGIKLNSIEEHVENTAQNAEKAEEEINKAKKIEAGNRKKLCCILWIAIFVVLAVIGLIYLIFRNMSK
jgi:t-SNARE complex subunit (syntaxin)